MPRPSKTPRLSTIDPSAVATQAARATAARDQLPLPEDPMVTDLARRVASLARYAQGGDAEAETKDALESVGATLYGGPWARVTEPSSALGVVVLAARARWKLAQAAPVQVAELAALAGLDPSHVRRLLRDGRVRRSRRGGVGRGAAIVAASATKLLADARAGRDAASAPSAEIPA